MADYLAIITVIDTAITSWAGKPVSLSVEGRSVTYRSLKSLIDARHYYAQLAAQAKGMGFKINPLKVSGPR